MQLLGKTAATQLFVAQTLPQKKHFINYYYVFRFLVAGVPWLQKDKKKTLI